MSELLFARKVVPSPRVAAIIGSSPARHKIRVSPPKQSTRTFFLRGMKGCPSDVGKEKGMSISGRHGRRSFTRRLAFVFCLLFKSQSGRQPHTQYTATKVCRKFRGEPCGTRRGERGLKKLCSFTSRGARFPALECGAIDALRVATFASPNRLRKIFRHHYACEHGVIFSRKWPASPPWRGGSTPARLD